MRVQIYDLPAKRFITNRQINARVTLPRSNNFSLLTGRTFSQTRVDSNNAQVFSRGEDRQIGRYERNFRQVTRRSRVQLDVRRLDRYTFTRCTVYLNLDVEVQTVIPYSCACTPLNRTPNGEATGRSRSGSSSYVCRDGSLLTSSIYYRPSSKYSTSA